MRQVPTLLLLHDGPGFDHSGFKPAFNEMAVVAQMVYLDLRGNGRSDGGAANKWSLEQWAKDVHCFCEALSIDAPIVVLVPPPNGIATASFQALVSKVRKVQLLYS
jgi:pimeloyl-ACP methyl ester carboxylesterase